MVEDLTMVKLEARQGIDINEPIRPSDAGEHQVNLLSQIINLSITLNLRDPILKNRIPPLRNSNKYAH